MREVQAVLLEILSGSILNRTLHLRMCISLYDELERGNENCNFGLTKISGLNG